MSVAGLCRAFRHCSIVRGVRAWAVAVGVGWALFCRGTRLMVGRAMSCGLSVVVGRAGPDGRGLWPRPLRTSFTIFDLRSMVKVSGVVVVTGGCSAKAQVHGSWEVNVRGRCRRVVGGGGVGVRNS